jgi:hypothetical protein
MIEHPPQDDSPEARLARSGQLLDVVVRLYAPLPAASLGYLCRLLRDGVPHLAAELRRVQEHAQSRYAHAQSTPAVVLAEGENPVAAGTQWTTGCLLTPFDPWSGTDGAQRSGLGIQTRGLCAGPQAPDGPTRCRCYGASTGLGKSKVVDGRLRPGSASVGQRYAARLSSGAGRRIAPDASVSEPRSSAFVNQDTQVEFGDVLLGQLPSRRG